MNNERQIRGLSSIQAKENLQKFGPNHIFTPQKINFFRIARHEVTEPMILLLFVVGFFYSIWGEFGDAVTIFTVIFLLVLSEVYNEFRAKKAISALEKIAAPRIRVLRDENISEVDSENIVPEDILILLPGTKISADARVEKAIGIQIDESALTGESFPLDKNTGDTIYAGTIVVSGEGEAKVFSTGKNTKLGKLAETAKQIRPAKTPLQLAMKSLAGKLVYVAAFFSIVIPILGILRGQNIKTMILTGLSLSFATIPEELPIVITMVLGLGAYTLSRNKFLVKRIKAAETLGNATVIVTDKTGTITENRMRIVSAYPNNEKEIISKAVDSLSEYSVSPLEQEIRNRANELKIDKKLHIAIRQRNIGNGKKTKSIIRKNGDIYELFTSGAPEEIFPVSKNIPDDIKNELDKQTSLGRRVIAFAYKKIPANELKNNFTGMENSMDFVGLISFKDPPRKGVKETIAKAKTAGIRTIMVTGDHPQTAVHIAKEAGILLEKEKILTGKDMDNLSDEELQDTVKTISVFARTTPEHKYRIVKALQKNGEIVAVTGDGINDALALKGADIGIAMGLKGTDVAKEAAEVVLADDNYITITQGIFEGRKFFDNLQKGIKYYLSVKSALIFIFLLPVLLGVPMPFAPIQIIILELFMDLAASAGFVAEPREKNIYIRPPRNPKENIFDNKTIASILIKGFFLFIAVISVYFYALYKNLSLKEAQTLAFSAWILGHIVLAFISRSDKESIFSLGVFTNKVINIWAVLAALFLLFGIYMPVLNDKFNLIPINPWQLLLIGIVVTLIIGLLEVKKLIKSN